MAGEEVEAKWDRIYSALPETEPQAVPLLLEKDYLLEENELLEMFKGMRLLVYREEGRVGELSAGRRDEAYFIGRKQKWKKSCSCRWGDSRD